MVKPESMFLFGPSGLDKIKRLKAGVTKDYQACVTKASTQLRKILAKNRKKRSTLVGYKRIPDAFALDREHSRICKQIDDIESGEGYKRCMDDMEIISEANAEEVQLQLKLAEQIAQTGVDIRSVGDIKFDYDIASAVMRCKDAFVRCKKLGIFTKELSIPTFINRNYCGKCNTPFYQQSETKVACKKCGCIEGNSEVLLAVLNEEPPLPYDRRNYFEDVLDLFHEKPELPEMPQLAQEIMTEIWLDRTRMEAKATGASVKKHLERIGKTKYTRYCNQIANYINNETVPIITAEQEYKALLVFLDLLDPFNTLKESSRSSFPNYHLLFRLICHMFGWTQFVPYLTMLRTEDKKEDQLKLIKTMFEYRGYPWPKAAELGI